MKHAIGLVSLLLLATPAFSQTTCKFLCEPTLLVEPTITWEKDATVFETIFALDLSTPIPRVAVTLEAMTKPFSDENDVELESELNLYWLEEGQSGGWLSSHFDIVDKFSPAERPTDRREYTHKLNLELDTSVSVFNWLPAGRWLRGVELEGSLDYVATGLPRKGDHLNGARFVDNASPWSFSIVFVIPIAPS